MLCRPLQLLLTWWHMNQFVYSSDSSPGDMSLHLLVGRGGSVVTVSDCQSR